MTWVYIIIAAVIIGLIVWMVAKKKNMDQDGSEPQGPQEPPATPGI